MARRTHVLARSGAGANGDATAHPSARFLRQVVEPLSRFSNVVVAGPLFRLVDEVVVPPPVLAKKVKTNLVLELSADDDLGALLLQRWTPPALSSLTITYHHQTYESFLSHHGAVAVPLVLSPLFYRAESLPLPQVRHRITWPCEELVLVDVFEHAHGTITQRLTKDAYDSRVSDATVRVNVRATMEQLWGRQGVEFEWQ